MARNNLSDSGSARRGRQKCVATRSIFARQAGSPIAACKSTSCSSSSPSSRSLLELLQSGSSASGLVLYSVASISFAVGRAVGSIGAWPTRRAERPGVQSFCYPSCLVQRDWEQSGADREQSGQGAEPSRPPGPARRGAERPETQPATPCEAPARFERGSRSARESDSDSGTACAEGVRSPRLAAAVQAWVRLRTQLRTPAIDLSGFQPARATVIRSAEIATSQTDSLVEFLVLRVRLPFKFDK